MKKIILFHFVYASLFAYIPSIPALLKYGPFEGRKSQEAIEIVFRHRILVNGSEVVELEERIVGDSGSALVLWEGKEKTVFRSKYSKGTYQIANGQKLKSKSRVFMSYFLGSRWESFRDVLLAEQFIRRDQLLEFKPGWVPEGDPKGWSMANSRLFHDDIFYNKNSKKTTITVYGLKNGEDLRSVSFSRDLSGVELLEWGDSNRKVSWDFERFEDYRMTSPRATLKLPRSSRFEISGNRMIDSELVVVRSLKSKDIAEYKKRWNGSKAQENWNSDFGDAIQLLTSYR